MSNWRGIQILKMWRHNNNCHWCGKATILIFRPDEYSRGNKHFSPNLQNEATLDHIDSRLSFERGLHPGEFRRVLACRKCNQERCVKEQESLPNESLNILSQLHGMTKKSKIMHKKHNGIINEQ